MKKSHAAILVILLAALFVLLRAASTPPWPDAAHRCTAGTGHPPPSAVRIAISIESFMTKETSVGPDVKSKLLWVGRPYESFG